MYWDGFAPQANGVMYIPPGYISATATKEPDLSWGFYRLVAPACIKAEVYELVAAALQRQPFSNSDLADAKALATLVSKGPLRRDAVAAGSPAAPAHPEAAKALEAPLDKGMDAKAEVAAPAPPAQATPPAEDTGTGAAAASEEALCGSWCSGRVGRRSSCCGGHSPSRSPSSGP